ncbi:MAG: TRAP transporter permease [Firmicutes bacterium]|nr:TRAP transporter permease [Bacillota bacterium]
MREDSASVLPPKADFKERTIVVLAIAFSLFQVWTNSYGIMMSMKQGGVFLAFTLALIFLTYPSGRGEFWRLVDWFLACGGAFVGLYTFFRAEQLAIRNLQAESLDYYMAALALILVIEAARRSIGIAMSILPVLFLVYAVFGKHLPGILGHYGFTIPRLLMRMYLVDEGIYGITLQVAATYIFLFILFGSFLAESGVGQFFTDLATWLTGSAVGGPAKVATLSSALMGTISGSAAANVATTGTFTIPMMKKVGFRPAFAGAVEAVASTGGMVMPPVMGAAAFVMSQYLNMNYGKIMVAAVIPALLYYLSVYCWVHFEALRLGLRGVLREELPPIKDPGRKVFLFLPIVVVVWSLLQGRTPIFSAFLGILSVVVASQVQRERMGLREVIRALEKGARASLTASSACIAAGIIVGVTAMTGLGQVITYNIIGLAHNNLIPALALTAIASLVLSMGLPATACYVITATIAAPALVRMGALPLAAHMFVFYFSCLSNITPPVAIASYTAAGIAHAKPFEVGWMSMRIAAPGFIIPFLFVMNPVLLAQATTPVQLLWPCATACAGVMFMAVGGVGCLWRPQSPLIRLGYLAGSLMLIDPNMITDVIGLAILGATLLYDFVSSRKSRDAETGR